MHEDGGERAGPEMPWYGFGRVLIVGIDFWSSTSITEWVEQAGFMAIRCQPQRVRETFAPARADLVVLDHEMLEPSVLEICGWLRSRSTVPIMVVAAKARSFDAVAAIDVGADLVVRAPVGPNELIARLRALLRRTPAQPEAALRIQQYGGLLLDTTHHLLHIGDSAIQLGNREYALMETLMSAGPRVTRRSALQSSLGISDSELDGHLRRLRQRIEPIEGWRRIVSERGYGLRLLPRRPQPFASLDIRQAPVSIRLGSEEDEGLSAESVSTDGRYDRFRVQR